MPLAIRDHFVAIEEGFLAYARTAGMLSSPAGIGRAREALITGFFEDHLPARLSIERGEVIDSSGASSGEADLIVVDQHSPAFRSGSEAIVPVEATPAVVEVKTSLRGRHLRDAVEKCARIKSLTRTQHHGFYREHEDGGYRIETPPRSPQAYIVAYTAPAWETIWNNIERNPDWYRHDFLRFGPDLIAVLGEGILWKLDGLVFESPPGHHLARAMPDEPGLAHLLGHLSEIVALFGGLQYEFTPYLERAG